MSGRWAGSTRAARLPPDWPARVAAVRARDGGRCRAAPGPGYAPAAPGGPRCPAPGVDCDHVVNGDDHSLPNLQLLCSDHHKAKTQQEAQAARAARRARGRHAVERQPGLL